MRLVVVAALSLGTAAACVKDDGSVFIQGAVPVDAQCVAKADSAIFVSSGLLDIVEPRGFTAALQVVTNLPSTFSNIDVTKSDTQTPNYPDFGSTDNNIIIFDSAEIDFEFQVDADAVADVEGVEIDGAAVFACDGSTCTAKGQQPAVSGTVFNEQTTLSSSAVVFVEALSATDATAFAEGLQNVLKFPDNRARVVAKVRLKGTTTGNGDLRPITTFTFPFPIDLCRGCLVPNAAFCDDAGATLQNVVPPPVSCFEGQDNTGVRECICDDGSVLGGTACP